MILNKSMAELLLTYKTMSASKFALFRRNANKTGYCYMQPGKTIGLPGRLGVYPEEGVLLDKDLQKNLEIVSIVSKLTDDDTVYCYPSDYGFNFLIYSDQGEKVYEGELKLVSAVGLLTKIQLKIIRHKLKKDGNKLYKMF